MDRKSLNELKNSFSTKEQLSINQLLFIKGGDGEDDEEKRRQAMFIRARPPRPIIIIKRF